MEKNVILSPASKAEFSLSSVLENTSFAQNASQLFSAIMEENVSPRQALLALNAMLALVCLMFPIGISIALRIVFFTWFAIAILQCKNAGMGEEE